MGPAWVLFQVIIYLGMFVAIRTFLNVPSDDKPYPIFAAVALVPWTFFLSSVTRAGGSAITNGSIIKKMPVQTEIFPLSSVCVSFIDLLFASSVVLVLAIWYELNINWTIVFLPLILLILATTAFGVSLIVGAVGVYRRDIIIVLPYVMQIWMLMSPIMYPLSSVPKEWHWLYGLNPIVGIIEGCRAVLLWGRIPNFELLGMSALGALIILAIAWPVHRTLSRYFADVL